MAPQRDKVRDVQYNQSLGRIASLVTNGSVQLWDPHLRLAGTVRAAQKLAAGAHGTPATLQRKAIGAMYARVPAVSPVLCSCLQV